MLRDAQGARVTKIDPGTYDVVVEDRSPEHNFHLTGPGVDRRTDLEFTGTTTWTVTFADGNYQYVCDPHATSMRGTLVSGTPLCGQSIHPCAGHGEVQARPDVRPWLRRSRSRPPRAKR